MEKLVKVKSQSPLRTSDYTDRRSQEQRKFYSVELVLSDGLDEFVAELTGDQALNAPTFAPNALYSVSCYMSRRTWTSQNGQPQQATTVTVRQIKAV